MTRMDFLQEKYRYQLTSLDESLNDNREWMQRKMEKATYSSDFNSISQIATECAELVAKIELVKTLLTELERFNKEA